jgi:DNA-directed RNA polymerase specialized sigma24 family protein
MALFTRSTVSLRDFNDRVRECQDEAFALACYLLGDERAAADRVGAAFLAAYRAGPRDFRLRVLRDVALNCAAAGDGVGRMTGLPPALAALSLRLRLPVLLVDWMGLSYPEAAAVCSLSLGNFRQRLAEARAQLVAGR